MSEIFDKNIFLLGILRRDAMHCVSARKFRINQNSIKLKMKQYGYGHQSIFESDINTIVKAMCSDFLTQDH
jgi:hypothetical protein